MNAQLQQSLVSIGFTVNEAKVYDALIILGSCMAGQIAKLTNMHRRPVYDSLERLIEKGLVSYTLKEGKKHFQAANPERLLNVVKEEESKIREMLPELIKKYESKKPSFFAEVYEGKSGVKSVFEDILKTGKTWYSVGTTGLGFIIMPTYMEQYHKRRAEIGVKRKMLLANTLRGREYYKKFKSLELCTIKLLPKEIENPQTLWIYGNKVAIALLSEDYPIIFLIENEAIAKSYKGYFDMLWKQSKKA